MFRFFFIIFILYFVSCTTKKEIGLQYSFWVDGFTAVRKIDDEKVDIRVPRNQVGKLTIDQNSDRFIYEFWNDYHHDVLHRKLRPRFLSTVSGFNGEFYWVAYIDQFEIKDVQLKAKRLYKFYKRPKTHENNTEIKAPEKTSGGLITNKGIVSRKIHPFYNYAPLHEFLARLNSKSLKKEDFIKELKASKFVEVKNNKYTYQPKVKDGQEDLPGHWKAREGGEWIYRIFLDNHQYPAKLFEVSHAASIWSGPWPYEMEGEYQIERGSFTELQEAYFSPEKYLNSMTKIEKHYIDN